MGTMQRAKRYRKERDGLAPKSCVTTMQQEALGQRVRVALAYAKYHSRMMGIVNQALQIRAAIREGNLASIQNQSNPERRVVTVGPSQRVDIASLVAALESENIQVVAK